MLASAFASSSGLLLQLARAGKSDSPSARHARLRLAVDAHANLVLVRHGQSEWNLANRFTGWVDVDLTERGIAEAREAARLLAADGVKLDVAVCSRLRRAIRTACLILSGTDQCWLPLHKDVRLNEQHSGFLTGHNKRELAQEYGVDQVMAWRRKYDQPPPPLGDDSPIQRQLLEDERYAGESVPSAESLQETCTRVDEIWTEQIKPSLQAGQNVMVVAHGNTLRALVKLVDGVSEEDTYHLDVPTAAPVVYPLDAACRPVQPFGFWGESSAVRHGRFLIAEERVLAAQKVMREQVVRDVALSTVSSGGDSIATCDAWIAPDTSRTQVAVDGESYTVRALGASYFAMERERIRREAQQELWRLRVQHRLRAWRSGGQFTGRGAGAQAPQVRATVILIRHGYSEYNLRNLFTGWVDAELSGRGREEARLAGSILRESGVKRVERVYCSMLKRSIKTAWLMLDEMEMQWVPITYNWRLNERHYGALQGREKRECGAEYGYCQVAKWRRGVSDAPPPRTHDTADTIDRRYDGVPVPESESLEQCHERMLPFLSEALLPDIRAAVRERNAAEGRGEPRGTAPIFVVASSENLMRTIVREFEGLDADELALVDVPHAVPLVYQLNADLEPVPSEWADAPLRKGWYMGDPERVNKVQASIRDEIVCRPSVDKGCEDEPAECNVAESSEEEGAGLYAPSEVT